MANLKNHHSGSALAQDPEKACRLRVMWEAGDALTVIATELRCGKSSISRAIDELGLPRRQSPVKPGTTPGTGRSVPKIAGPTVEIFAAPVVVERPAFERDRLPGECQWIINSGRPWRFCGDSCVGLYCEDHSRLARGAKPAKLENVE